MALFRRRPRPHDSPADVDAFWQWWSAEGAARTAEAIDARDLDAWASVLSQRVDAVHPGLAWELGAGAASEHVLVVTAEGDPELRSVARRWRRAAPAADRVWEYSDVRLPTDGLDWSLTLDGRGVEAAEVRVAVTPVHDGVDVVVHAPAFADLDQQARDTAAFLLLDAALGEAAVDTWVGAVESSGEPAPPAAEDLEVLRRRVAELDAGDELQWAALEATASDGRPVMALAQVPLRPMTAPHLDTHVRVEMAFQADAVGLPTQASLDELRALEQQLAERVGDSGRVVAHETTGGVRTLHVYVDSETPAAAQVEAALVGRAGPRPSVRVERDPAWDAVRHLRG